MKTRACSGTVAAQPVILDISIIGGSGQFGLIRSDGMTMHPNGSSPGSAHWVLYPGMGLTQYDLHIAPQVAGGGAQSALLSVSEGGSAMSTLDESNHPVLFPEKLTALNNGIDNPMVIAIGLT